MFGDLVAYIDIQRAFTPEEMLPTYCAGCQTYFQPQGVLAFALTEERFELGRMCPLCAEFYGAGEHLEDAVRRYPEPVYLYTLRFRRHKAIP